MPAAFKKALDNVSASSAGGAPFLIAYGLTFIVSGSLTFFLPREISALVAMFQGVVALPLAFWLEKRMGSEERDPKSPLNALSAQMAMSQALALPALIVAYNVNPGMIPVLLASLGGVHFFPYAWLHRTGHYAALGIILSVGAFLIQIFLGSDAYAVILFYVGLVYWISAPVLHRHAKRLVAKTS